MNKFLCIAGYIAGFFALLMTMMICTVTIGDWIAANSKKPVASYDTYSIVQKIEAQTKHDEAHFDRIETMIQQLNDRVAALEEKQNERKKK